MKFIINLWVDGCEETPEEKEQFRQLIEEYLDFGASSVRCKIVEDEEISAKYFSEGDGEE